MYSLNHFLYALRDLVIMTFSSLALKVRQILLFVMMQHTQVIKNFCDAIVTAQELHQWCFYHFCMCFGQLCHKLEICYCAVFCLINSPNLLLCFTYLVSHSSLLISPAVVMIAERVQVHNWLYIVYHGCIDTKVDVSLTFIWVHFS